MVGVIHVFMAMFWPLIGMYDFEYNVMPSASS